MGKGLKMRDIPARVKRGVRKLTGSLFSQKPGPPSDPLISKLKKIPGLEFEVQKPRKSGLKEAKELGVPRRFVPNNVTIVITNDPRGPKSAVQALQELRPGHLGNRSGFDLLLNEQALVTREEPQTSEEVPPDDNDYPMGLQDDFPAYGPIYTAPTPASRRLFARRGDHRNRRVIQTERWNQDMHPQLVPAFMEYDVNSRSGRQRIDLDAPNPVPCSCNGFRSKLFTVTLVRLEGMYRFSAQ